MEISQCFNDLNGPITNLFLREMRESGMLPRFISLKFVELAEILTFREWKNKENVIFLLLNEINT